MIAKGIKIETLEDLVNMSESAAATTDPHASSGSASAAKVRQLDNQLNQPGFFTN